MKKDEIFFAEQGLTTTSANYCANIAKELYNKIEDELNGIRLYSTTIGLIGSKDFSLVCKGVDDKFIDEIDDKLHKIADYKSLIAWLREAISAKDRLIKEAKGLSNMQICEALGIEYPKELEHYVRMDSDDIIATWNIKQRNRYYYVETLCSTLGQYIHEKGKFNTQRDELTKIISTPNNYDGNGRDTVIHHYEPTCSPKKVDEVFFDLQAKYRGYQAELNSMKHEIELALQEDDREKTAKERAESQNYCAQTAAISNQIAEYRKKEVAKAQALKITIPDSLKKIYEIVSQTGKK